MFMFGGGGTLCYLRKGVDCRNSPRVVPEATGVPTWNAKHMY